MNYADATMNAYQAAQVAAGGKVTQTAKAAIAKMQAQNLQQAQQAAQQKKTQKKTTQAQQKASQPAAAPQQATQQSQTATTQATQNSTPSNATSPNVKAYFGNNNGGFKDTKDLLANQAKIEAWLDSAASQLTGDKTPQWLAAEAMGFNAKPNAVQSISALPNQANRVIMYRGVSGSASYAQQFKTGDNYPGVGIYGDGAYFQLSYAGAQQYAGTSNKAHVISVSVDTSKLRIISEPELRKMRNQMISSPKCSQRVKDLIYGNKITTSSGSTKFPSNHRASQDSSLGTFATLLGYDAIYVPGGNGGQVAKSQPTNAGKNNDFYVILNRGAVDVKAGY